MFDPSKHLEIDHGWLVKLSKGELCSRESLLKVYAWNEENYLSQRIAGHVSLVKARETGGSCHFFFFCPFPLSFSWLK